MTGAIRPGAPSNIGLLAIFDHFCPVKGCFHGIYRPRGRPPGDPKKVCSRCREKGLEVTQHEVDHEPDVDVEVLPGPQQHRCTAVIVEPYGSCIVCGTDLYPTGRRGRHPTKCPACRDGKPVEPVEIYMPDIEPLEPGSPWDGCRSCGVPMPRKGGAGRPRKHCTWCLEVDS